MDGETSRRLDSLEDKIDGLTEAVVTLARVEERQTATTDALRRFGQRLDGHDQRFISTEERVSSIEQMCLMYKLKAGFIDKIWWIVFTALITAGVTIWVTKLMGV